MEVLLEPVEGRVRATSGAPLNAVAEGATDDEALTNLHQMVAERLRNGARVVDIPLLPDKASDPWLAIGGIFKDDPLFEQWQEAVQEYRRQKDGEEGPW